MMRDAAANIQFEKAFGREVLRSERLRVTIVICGLLLLFARGIILYVFFNDYVTTQIGGGLKIAAMATVGAVALLFEVIVLLRLRLAIEHDLHPPRLLRYLNALVETSIPTLATLVAVDAVVPGLAVHSPIVWGYFLFIVLATLHLDFWLCAFTGLVAGVEYGLLAWYYLSQPQPAALDPFLSGQFVHGTRVLILIGAGVLAGVVSLQIRRQFQHAMRSVEDRNRIVGMFGQHVSPAVVDKLISQDVELAGEVRHVCVMFLDIQGFTSYSENRTPEEVVQYLNSLFSFMIDSVNSHNGIVNKFLGDGFMAVFGAPIEDASDCRNAVAASLEIISAVNRLSADGKIAPTHIRIGLHAGEAVTGNVGSTARKEYTIIGDVVNLASRLEQMNKQFGSSLLVSETVVGRVDGMQATATPHGEIQVRGREQPVKVFELA